MTKCLQARYHYRKGDTCIECLYAPYCLIALNTVLYPCCASSGSTATLLSVTEWLNSYNLFSPLQHSVKFLWL